MSVEQPDTSGADVGEEVTAACTAENSPRIAAIQDVGSLAWGIGISPPFGFKDNSGDFAGVETDNAEELANILGVEPTIRDFDYGVMPTALQSDQVDIVSAQLFITEERDEAIDFSTPYYLSGQLFYVLEDSPWQTIEDLNSPDNRFVYGTGGAQKEIAENRIPEAEIFDAPLRGQLLLYEFLVSGQADSSMVESAPMGVLKSSTPVPSSPPLGCAVGSRATPLKRKTSSTRSTSPSDCPRARRAGRRASTRGCRMHSTAAGCSSAWTTGCHRTSLGRTPGVLGQYDLGGAA